MSRSQNHVSLLFLTILTSILSFELRAGDIQLSESKLDFGTVASGGLTRRELKLTNLGKRKLTVDSKTTCRCFEITEGERLSLEPGETGVVKIRARSDLFSGLSQKKLNISNAVNGAPIAQVDLRVDIVPNFSVSTRALDLGRVQIGEQGEGEVELFYYHEDDGDYRFGTSQIKNEGLKVQIGEIKKDAKNEFGRYRTSAKMKVTLAAEKLGNTVERISLGVWDQRSNRYLLSLILTMQVKIEGSDKDGAMAYDASEVELMVSRSLTPPVKQRVFRNVVDAFRTVEIRYYDALGVQIQDEAAWIEVKEVGATQKEKKVAVLQMSLSPFALNQWSEDADQGLLDGAEITGSLEIDVEYSESQTLKEAGAFKETLVKRIPYRIRFVKTP